MAKQVNISHLRQASERYKQYVDDQATAQVIRTETVLYSGTAGTVGDTYNLSESVENFDVIKVYAKIDATSGNYSFIEKEIDGVELNTGIGALYPIDYDSVHPDPDTRVATIITVTFPSNTTFKVNVSRVVPSDTPTISGPPYVYKVTGIKYTVPETYSLNEQIVGTWIDGRPLYQKTVVIANPVMDNWSNLISYASLGINNIDKVWKVDSAFVTVSTPSLSWTMNEFYSSAQDNFCVAVFNTEIRIGYANTATNRSFSNLTFTLKYTKTS